jgi:hypothetical protein
MFVPFRYVVSERCDGDEARCRIDPCRVERPSLPRVVGGAIFVAFSLGSIRAHAAASASSSGHSGTTSDDDEDESTFTFGAEADLNARYLWRGLALSSGPVVQPSVWASAFGFNAVLWANVMLTDEASNRLTAIVPALTYTLKWKSLTIEPGVIYYDISGPILPSTAEASLEASVALGFLHWRTTDYVDVLHAPGACFGTLGASLEPKVGRWSFSALADVAWATPAYNQVYFDTHVAALDLADFGASAQVDLSDVFYLAVHSEVSALLADLADSASVGRERILANVGLTFGGELGL